MMKGPEGDIGRSLTQLTCQRIKISGVRREITYWTEKSKKSG